MTLTEIQFTDAHGNTYQCTESRQITSANRDGVDLLVGIEKAQFSQ